MNTSMVNIHIVTAIDLPWKLIQETEYLPYSAKKVIDVLKDKDIGVVNALIKNLPAFTQFIRDLKHTDMTLTDEQIADRVLSAFNPKKASYHLLVVGSDTMPDPGEQSESVFQDLDKIKAVNADKPAIIRTLDSMKNHIILNHMTAAEVKLLLRYELSRHPEWNVKLTD